MTMLAKSIAGPSKQMAKETSGETIDELIAIAAYGKLIEKIIAMVDDDDADL